MTRGATITVQNDFTKGLITEFTAMNFPENAVTEGDNCVYSEFGLVERRLGMDYEDDFVKQSVGTYTPTTDATVEFAWHSVGNVGTTQFLVQQLGSTIYFFTAGSSLSANKKSFSINLNTYRTSGSTTTDTRTQPCQFTAGKGYLFLVHPTCNPLYVSYDEGTDNITVAAINIQTRDFEGVKDHLEIETRPSTLSDLHKYNLYNQGWYFDTFSSGTLTNVLQFWDNHRIDFPSNADIWWLYKDSNEDLNFTLFDKFTLGNTPAAKGHYVYDAFNIDRTAMTGIPGLTTQSAGASRPSAIAFYAGRIFYAGVHQNGFSDKLYFTQIIESDDQFGRCYQVNDPTSETIFDLLDTDGGTILLPLIEDIVSMRVLNDALIIIGTNAIFSIRGTNNGPFKATDYSVEYVSSIGGTSDTANVSVDDGMIWINYDAMYATTKDQTGIFFSVQNISKATIQTLLDSIPSANKPFIKGAYNKKDQKVQWLFSDDEDLTGYQFNRILEFNIVSKAFYTYTIDTTIGPKVSGLITIPGLKLTLEEENVFDNADVQVTDNASSNVTIENQVFVPNSELFKYLTFISGSPNKVTYSELWNIEHLDWISQNLVGADYDSYGLSGYRIRGDFTRSFNSTPIVFLIKNVESGRCLISGIWDYGFRETSTQELYLTRPEVAYQIRRIKLRGKGKSLQIKFQSVGNSPFQLVGWSSFDSGGTMP